MNIFARFESFAADFETAVRDDDWSVLEQHLAPDATYLNVGGPEPRIKGRKAILEYFAKDVSDFDRRFDSRALVALTPPKTEGNQLSRKWRCTYLLAGAPDLVVEGEARYTFERDLIKEIEQQPTTAAIRKVDEWMQKHAGKLHG